jgi:prophage antirepressor-like protein
MDKTFFLDIFNKILKFGEKEISIIFDSNGDIWFGLRDVLKVLDYKNYKKALQNIYITKNNRKKYKYIGVPLEGYPFHKNLQPNTIFINESGLYQILSNSTKPIAKLFMNKYFTEIMPQIRKSGKYEVSKKDMKKIKNLNEKIDNYKQELSHFEKKEYEKSKNGYFYISEDITIQNGKEIKCFKIGYCKDIQQRMSVYKVGHYKHKLLSYIPIVLDGKQLENCVKNKMRLHLKKIGSDTICFTSLKKLKDEINSCNNFIKDHICHCMMCKKKYKLKNIEKHLCNKKIDIINI